MPHASAQSVALRSRSILSWLEPARVGAMSAVIVNVWMMVYFALQLEPQRMCNPQLVGLGLIGSLVASGLMAAGLAGFGLALNDVLDMRHDRRFLPQRPVASGRVHWRTAGLLGLLSVATGLYAAAWLGRESLSLAGLATAGLLLYNFVGRFFPAIGTLLLGLIYAATMVAVNPQLSFAWPVVLAVSHVMFSATLIRMLSPAPGRGASGRQTDSMPGGRGAMGRWEGWILVIGWAFFILLMTVVMSVRVNHLEGRTWWIAGWVWIGPAVALAGYAAVGFVVVQAGTRSVRSRRAAAERLRRLSQTWLWVYAVAWLASAGLWQGAAVTGFAGFVAWLAGRLSALDAATRPRYQLSRHDESLLPPV